MLFSFSVFGIQIERSIIPAIPAFRQSCSGASIAEVIIHIVEIAWRQKYFSWYAVAMSTPELTSDQQSALQQNHGLVEGTSYVLMTVDMYREILGVGTDAELAESVGAVKEAMEDVQAGRTMTMDEAQKRLDDKYGIHD